MKQLVVKILIFSCLISFTPIKELVKAPLLLLHYMEHLEEMPDMTIQQFLYMHYTIGFHVDDDIMKDFQLPFKTMDFTHLPMFLLTGLNDVFKSFQLTEIQFFNKLNSSYNFPLKDVKSLGIFHPPKF